MESRQAVKCKSNVHNDEVSKYAQCKQSGFWT